MDAVDLEQETIVSLSRKMTAGIINAESLTTQCLSRIAEIDPRVNAVIELNPDALTIAAQLDEESRAGRVRGPLHGLPIMIKDNLDTADRMMTTAGSLAMFGSYAKYDSHVVKRLRDAGAVIIGKTNLSEWANFRSTRSSSGWSSRGGQTRNAYAHNRSPGGSSSGSAVAVAAAFCIAAIGTETDGSIISPSSMNSIVGIKPTVGLVSRVGIIPISHTQDTAGPMARNVIDAAIILNTISGEDVSDPATVSVSLNNVAVNPFNLDVDSLVGAHIGVARNYAGFHEGVDALFEEVVIALEDAGAKVVDELYLTPMSEIRPSETIVMCSEFRNGLNRYLAERAPCAKIRSLSDLIDYNNIHQEDVMPWFRQEILEMSQSMDDLENENYNAALNVCHKLARQRGIDELVGKHKLDAIIAPSTCTPWMIDLINGDNRTGGSSCPAAVSGYPNVTVPAGYVHGLPVGVSFFSSAWQDTKLLNLAYAYEQKTKNRIPPSFS